MGYAGMNWRGVVGGGTPWGRIIAMTLVFRQQLNEDLDPAEDTLEVSSTRAQ